MSAPAGYALAVYRFRGRETVFNVLLTGVLMPPVVLAVPQYLLLAEVNLTDTHLSVLLPYIMPGDDEKFPVTLGLFTLLQQGSNTPALYTRSSPGPCWPSCR